jgi:hypothetical protein
VYFFTSSFLIGFSTSTKNSIHFSIAELYTANIYSNRASEEIILEKYNIPRHKVIVLSKCFAYVGDEPQVKNPLEVKLLFA